MNLEELKEAEDGFDETGRKAIDMYRQKHLQECKSLQRKQKNVKLRETRGKQYAKEIDKCSRGCLGYNSSILVKVITFLHKM
ncbi:hypothetical protein Nmel_007149 [Mimus melanotis]